MTLVYRNKPNEQITGINMLKIQHFSPNTYSARYVVPISPLEERVLSVQDDLVLLAEHNQGDGPLEGHEAPDRRQQPAATTQILIYKNKRCGFAFGYRDSSPVFLS